MGSEEVSTMREELHCLYHLLSILRVIKCVSLRWAGHIAKMDEARNVFRMLTRKPTRNKSLIRPICIVLYCIVFYLMGWS